MLQIHLDESVDTAVAEGLRQRGIDVTKPVDVGLLGARDTEHLRFAANAGRVIVTHDRDFLRLAQQSVAHRGIAYCHQHAHSLGDLMRSVAMLAECFDPAEMIDRIEYL